MKGRGRADAPFVYQTLGALDAIEEAFEGRGLATAIAIYVGLTRLANDRGGGTSSFRAEVGEVAARSGVSVRTVRDYAPKLEAAGLLVVHRSEGEANGWELVEPGRTPAVAAAPPANGAGVPRQQPQGSLLKGEKETSSSSSSATPSEGIGWADTPGVEASMLTDARELVRRKTRVGGKVVTAGEMQIAACALSEFNRQSGSDYGLGSWLTPIVGRIRERPSFDAAAHIRLVQSAWRIRWWEKSGNGRRPTPQVVYGKATVFENVVQDATDEAKGVEREAAAPVDRFKRTKKRDEF